MRLSGHPDQVELLFGLEAGYWLLIQWLVKFWLVVELDFVPGTMGPGWCSQPTAGSLGSASQAGRAGPLLEMAP